MSPGPKPQSSDPRGGRRVSLPARKRAERRHGRGRAAALTRVALSPEQRQHEALPPVHAHGPVRRGAWVVLLLVGSAAVHVGVVAAGFFVTGRQNDRRAPARQEVEIEMKEKKVEPPPPPVAPPPEPERPMRVPPKVAKIDPVPEKPPEPKKAAPPPRVVGLSFESTSEGGSGPAFAVGNTRAGQTAEKAVAPADVPSQAPPAVEEAPKTNKVANRIPVAGVKYEQPRRKSPNKPPYPETLKSQGLEADVTVMVNLDAAGKVVSVKIIRESPYPEFNEAARKAALAEEYEPATRDGVAIPFTLSFTYRFRLEEQ
jgi:protein TonB